MNHGDSAELKSRWVAALRSGRYQQGKRRLSIRHRNGRESNCCLGVLCRVARVRGWRDGAMLRDSDAGTDLAGQIGLGVHEEIELSLMNDNRNKSFREIADWIEKNL